jgi:hypothetical protein
VTELHTPFDSLEAMLSVEAISALDRRAITQLTIESWTPPQYSAVSESEFLKVRSVGLVGRQHYFVKRTRYTTDIVRRLTADQECRERKIWQHGLLDCLPVEVESPRVACARDGDGWALLMRDESESLQKLERRRAGKWNTLSRGQVSTIVDALASMHARFYADPLLSEPALGL